jgi:hypothetical protein
LIASAVFLDSTPHFDPLFLLLLLLLLLLPPQETPKLNMQAPFPKKARSVTPYKPKIPANKLLSFFLSFFLTCCCSILDSLDLTAAPHPRFPVQSHILSVGGDALKLEPDKRFLVCGYKLASICHISSKLSAFHFPRTPLFFAGARTG